MTHIERVALHEMAQSRYLNYALSVITSRALPDVRDGMKPVQRRILYGMHQLRLMPDGRHRKSAQVVGEVMGKYHPHGDSAIYDAMVRMAQYFSLRYPLVDGQGNFGSLDGDGAAAMRYTEAKLAPIAVQLLDELSHNTVGFRANYDGTQEEPIVLPAALPMMLLNGATGIAVGMATNIPPHHLGEVISGCIALVQNPELSTSQLLEHVPAPDFPTGGRILNTRDELLSIYETGQGPVELRGEYTVEKEGRRRQIVISSIPYAVNKAQLIEKIADAIREDKVPQLTDIRDESTDIVRIVIDLKQNADAETAMAFLFKHTPLQTRFHVNMTALVPTENEEVGRPERLGLKAVLQHFLDFRFEVVTRRLTYLLEQLRARIHILEGFEIIFDALDEAIAIIRESKDKKHAAERLMERFTLSEAQTEAILEIRLYRLAQLEIAKIRNELAAKRKEARRLERLLRSDKLRWKLITDELETIRKQFGDKRRSVIGGPDKRFDYSEENYIVDEDVFVCITREGWIKRQKSYTDLSTIRIRDGDELGWVLAGSTRRSVIFFTDRGRAYTMRIDTVPATFGHGEPVQRHFEFEDGEHIIAALTADPRTLPAPLESLRILPVTKAGQVASLDLESYEPVSTVNGRLFMRLQSKKKPWDGVTDVLLYDGREAWLSLVSQTGRALTFDVSEVSELKRPGKGVRAIALAKDDVVLGAQLTHELDAGLQVETTRGRTELISPRRYPPVSRGARGRFIVRRGKPAQVLRPTLEVEARAEDDAATPA